MIPTRRPWLTTWGEVVASLAELDPADMVCFGSGPNSPDDPCMVVDTVELDEDEDVPPEAAGRGWTTVLITDQIEDVVDNLEQQIPNPDLATILRATAHYVDHDAFIELPEEAADDPQ
ncbi:hypothetical protein ACFOWZ_32025 [Lentzea rhizosphaerae]|uniref:DUF7716 domain-containing protein n=1 Tax=Lentzea rhizosphaerae TaxID=2041025 RepID=A0ABV8C2J8_9PSEU